MTQDEKNKVAVHMAYLAGYYGGKELTKPVIAMMIEDLEDLNFEDVMNAYKSYRRNPKHTAFPVPAKIRDIVRPTLTPETQANEAASRIRQAITKCGWPDPISAREYIGELGWQVVMRAGGWKYVCENHGVDLNPLTFHAQARDLAKSMIETERAGMGTEPIQISGSEPKQIEKLNEGVS